ncbi:MAG: hypothetical protein WBY93_13685 [Candidatus Binatus sp.]
MAFTVTSRQPVQRRVRRTQAFSFLRNHALECFILLEYTCQLALLSSDIGQLRQLVRMTVFGTSILMLTLLSGRGEPSPSAAPAKLVLGIVALSMFHPKTNTILAGSAQIALYLAILSPLFWVPRLKVDTPVLLRLMMIIWIFQTTSAAVGILQVYYPGHFEPSLATVTQKMGAGYLKSLQFRNAYGEVTWRAMGLTDTPGAAANAGFYAALLGTAFMLTFRRTPARMLALGAIIVGLVAIYLSKNRSCLIVLGICELGIAGMTGMRRTLLVLRPQWRKREAGNLPRLLMAIGIAAVLSFSWAMAIGGGSIGERFASLLADKPSEVYRQNRGHIIEDNIESLLPKYPLGAGIGRWGMINYYFGDDRNPDSGGIWVEEQWTGWLLDGGIPLIAVYVFTIFLAFRTAFRIGLSPVEPELAIFAIVICGYDVGAFAATFGYPYFTSQDGLEFWLLNAALFAAVSGFRKRMLAETANSGQRNRARIPGGRPQPVRA